MWNLANITVIFTLLLLFVISSNLPQQTSALTPGYTTPNAKQQEQTQTQQAIYTTRFIQDSLNCQWPCIGGLRVGESIRQNVLDQLDENFLFIRIHTTQSDDVGGISDTFGTPGNSMRLDLIYDQNDTLQVINLYVSDEDNAFEYIFDQELGNLSFQSVLQAVDETPEVFLRAVNLEEIVLVMTFPETGLQITGTFDLSDDAADIIEGESLPICLGINSMLYFHAEIRNLEEGERFEYDPPGHQQHELIDVHPAFPTSAEFEDMLLAAGDDGCLPLMGNSPMTPTRTPNVTPTATP